MTKEKKSFFERLTGAQQVAMDEENTERLAVSSHDEETPITTHDNFATAQSSFGGSATGNFSMHQTSPEPMTQQQPQAAPAWSTPEEPTHTSFSTSSDEDDADGQLTIDVYQTENDIVIKSTIAGVKPEDLDVSINNDMVTIRGERSNEEVVDTGNYYYQECYWGSFSRSVLLPVDIMPDKVDASLKNGILTIRLPKADVTKTKKIQVRGF